MFSSLPVFSIIETASLFASLPRPIELHHSTARDVSYRSRGIERTGETHCIFHYTVRGQGEVIYNGKAFRTKPGEGFINIINDPLSGYGYPMDAYEPWEFVVLCFDGGNSRDIASEFLSRQVVYDITPGINEFRRLCADITSGRISAGQGAVYVARLISLLQLQNDNPLCQSFRTLVHSSLNKNPTIASIADKLKVSREHLQRKGYFARIPAQAVQNT